MTRGFKTETIVMKRKDLLDKDSLVFLFTKLEGKIVAIVKGVKKITSRRAPHLQTGNLLDIYIHRKNDRIYLEQSNLLSGFSELKKNSEKIKILYRFFFVLDRLLPEHQKEEVVYNLTKSFLIKLSQSASSNEILPLYLNKLLKALGYTKEDHDRRELEEIISDLIDEKLPTFYLTSFDYNI